MVRFILLEKNTGRPELQLLATFKRQKLRENAKIGEFFDQNKTSGNAVLRETKIN